MTKGKQINITTQARFQTISKSTNNKQISVRRRQEVVQIRRQKVVQASFQGV